MSFELRVLGLCSVGPFVVLGWRFYTLEEVVNQFRDLALQSRWAASILETTPFVLCARDCFLFSVSQRWDMKLRHLGLGKTDAGDSTQSQKSGRNSNPRPARS